MQQTLGIEYHQLMDGNRDLRAWKPAMMHTFESQSYTTAVTLAWNRPVGRVRARADLAKLVAFIDRQLLGPRFHERLAEARTDAVFVFEGYDTGHVHVHSLWRAPQNRWFELGKLFGDWRSAKLSQRRSPTSTFTGPRVGVWNKVVPTGSHCITAMNVVGGNDEITGYILKGQHAGSDVRDIVWASEFHRLS